MKLHRYWIEFEEVEPYDTLNLGCGVTAFNVEDALRLVQEKVFRDKPMLKIKTLIEDVDVSTLDEGHVRGQMGLVIHRGVWFPLGYDQKSPAG